MVDTKEAKKEIKAPKAEKIVPTKSASSSAELKKVEAPKPAEKKDAKATAKTEVSTFDSWAILKTPYLTEKSTRMIESQNKLVFLVKERATKTEIKKAVEAAFSVKVADINTTSTMKGEKKAYVRLKPEFKAIDVATKLGMM